MLWPSATFTSLGVAYLLNKPVPGTTLPFLSVRGHQNCSTCTKALFGAALRGPAWPERRPGPYRISQWDLGKKRISGARGGPWGAGAVPEDGFNWVSV